MAELADEMDVVEHTRRGLVEVDEEACVALTLVGCKVFSGELVAHFKSYLSVRYVVYFAQLYETMTKAASVYHQYFVGGGKHVHHSGLHRCCARARDKYHARAFRSFGKLCHQSLIFFHCSRKLGSSEIRNLFGANGTNRLARHNRSYCKIKHIFPFTLSLNDGVSFFLYGFTFYLLCTFPNVLMLVYLRHRFRRRLAGTPCRRI